MKIKSLKLTNFRSYNRADIIFGQNNVIVGPNAQGKTNLLEALYLTSVGKSFRAKEVDIVKKGEDFFRVEVEVENDRPLKIEYIYEKNVGRGRKTIKINGVKKPAVALLDSLKCVFFTPDEIDMFFAFPSVRRRHINIVLSQIDKEYARQLVRYRRTLEQRNALLKSIAEGRKQESELELWDGELAECGAKLMEKRRDIVEALCKTLDKNHRSISETDSSLILKYEPSVNSSGKKGSAWESYVSVLIANRSRDIASRVTTKGPHRDDFIFYLDDSPALPFASRGEMRSFIIALKFSEKDVLKEKTGEQPIMLLDDVFSELDERRRKHLVESFSGQQTVTTTTDLDHIDKLLRKEADIFRIEKGKITKITN